MQSSVEPTYYHTILDAKPNVLDISPMKNIAVNSELYIVDDLSSDHNPVLLHVDGVADTTEVTTTHYDWPAFTRMVEECATYPSRGRGKREWTCYQTSSDNLSPRETEPGNGGNTNRSAIGTYRLAHEVKKVLADNRNLK